MGEASDQRAEVPLHDPHGRVTRDEAEAHARALRESKATGKTRGERTPTDVLAKGCTACEWLVTNGYGRFCEKPYKEDQWPV